MLVASMLINLTILFGCAETITLAWMVLTRLRHSTPACTLTPYTRPYLRLCLMSSLTLAILTVVTILYLAFGVTPVDILAAIRLRVPVTANRQMLIIGVGLQIVLRLVSKTYGILDVRWRLFPHRRAENRGTGSQELLHGDASEAAMADPSLVSPETLTPRNKGKS